ncbi:DUF397 domain-containing protein [Streptomyces sp. NPDC048290]|uniref:DUF397 domain-containing protein n=1 Tax=Streptomyces sp. NPDC048290 TaxID=3155811 RepID=UPI0034389312
MTEQHASRTARDLAARAARWQWRKSSYSNDSGGNCLEIAHRDSSVGIRDSKYPKGPALVVSTAAWSSFVPLVRRDR